MDKENVKRRETEALLGQPADYEMAIRLTGLGKFNLLLILVSLPASIATMLQNTTVSYILPAAQCDLKLTENHKGLLNASTYLGMFCGSLLWGFLADMYGRRKIIMYAHLFDGCVVLTSSFTQSFGMLMTVKFFGGFVITAAVGGLSTYLPEFFALHLRARVLTLRGLFITSSAMVLAAVAWVIYPLDINIAVFEGFDLHGWNVLLMILCLPSFFACTGLYFLPESPKFLMSASRNDEALKVLQKIYSMNTGEPGDRYPVKSLIEEAGVIPGGIDTFKGFISWWSQFKPLFLPPYFTKLIKMCLMDFLIYTGLLGIQLWLPQMYTTMNNYKGSNNGTAASLCQMLTSVGLNKSSRNTSACHTNVTNTSTYMNTFIIFGVTTLFCVVVIFAIEKFSKKTILVGSLFISAVMFYSTYLAQDVVSVTALLSVYMALMNPCISLTISVEVEIFPTSLRATSIVIALMCGKMGAVVGNLLFPLLMKAGCLSVFLFYGTIVFGAAFIGLFIPNTEKRPLQ